MQIRLVHGFTQTNRSWEAMEKRLPGDWDVQAVDVPDGLDFVGTADTLGIRSGSGVWVGYSMGGRLCLRLALDRPSVVERLVLISASPGITGAAEREQRRAADERLAQEAEREGVGVFIDRWLAQPLFETLSREAAMVDDRIRRNSPYRIAHQLRALGQAAHDPLWPRLADLEVPTLIITGAYDRKYGEVGAQMAAAIGANARAVTVPRAGHAVHLERPDEVAALLVDWLRDAPTE